VSLALAALGALGALALPAVTVDAAGAVTVTVTVDDKLKQPKTAGDADVTVAGGVVKIRAKPGKDDGAVSVHVDELDVIVAGDGARVDAKGVAGKALSIRAAGGANVDVAGKGVDALRVDGKGTAHVDTTALPAERADVTLRDAARAAVKATKALDCDLQRAARLVVKGRPASVTKNVGGVAKLVVE
jgi:hypothetical protein